jgi:hypothetical protein
MRSTKQVEMQRAAPISIGTWRPPAGYYNPEYLL